MKNLSLSVKIWLIVMLMIAGGGFISYMGISKMANIMAILTKITDVYVVRDGLTSDIQGQQRSISILAKDILIEKSADKIPQMEKDLQGMEEKWNTMIDEYNKIASVEEKELIAKYKITVDKLSKLYAKTTDLVKKNQQDEAIKAMLTEEDAIRKEARKYIGEMNDITSKSLDSITAQAKNDYAEARNLVIVICLATLLLSIMIAYVVLRSLNRAIDRVISDLNDNSAQVTSAAQQIASSSEELSQAATEQASSLEETSASVEEMSSMIRKNAQGAMKSSDSSHSSSDSAKLGKQVVEEMVNAMQDIDHANAEIMDQINASNQEISDIVKVIAEIGNKTKVINEIVFQTKLLSFNASVEAARAGEHGKGFAVVAEEVGNLAQMSGNAAKEISEMLDGSILKVEGIVNDTKTKVDALISKGKSKVELGSQVAKRCGEVLDEIVSNVESVTVMVGDIATSSDEQAKGIEEITRAIGQLDQVTQQNAAVSEEAASAAQQLSNQADSLRNVVLMLIQTVKGKNATEEVQNTATVHRIEKKQTAAIHLQTKKEKGHIIHLGTKHESHVKPTTHEPLKMAVGSESIPPETDPRFKDV